MTTGIGSLTEELAKAVAKAALPLWVEINCAISVSTTQNIVYTYCIYIRHCKYM